MTDLFSAYSAIAEAPSPTPSPPRRGRGRKGRVTKITQRPTATTTLVTTFTYDPANGNLLTTTDPLNHTTTIAYNSFGQPTSVTDPLTNVTTFAYDTVGNLMTTTDPLGNATQRAYDAVSRLTALTDPRNLGKTGTDLFYLLRTAWPSTFHPSSYPGSNILHKSRASG